MEQHYGNKKAKEVFYAMANSGKIKGAHKSPPSGVDGYTTTTDLPHSADHGTSPVPADKSETDATVQGTLPDGVQNFGTFHGSPYKGEPKMNESETKGPTIEADPPADVQKFTWSNPKKGK
jgi:hypothetical protein